MSDDDENIISTYGKEYGKEGINAGIKKGGDLLFDKIKTTYRLKTSKKPLSIKTYSKGWHGKGFVKTYKVSSLAKGALGAVLNFGETAYTFCKYGISRKFAGSLGSSIGSLLAGGAAGMAAGSIIPGIGNIAGFFIGVGAAALGSIGGEYIGEKIYDRISDLKDGGNKSENIKDNRGDNNDLTGGGETGGVEFEIPKEIKGFNELLFFNKFQNQCIIFKNDFSNINEILEVSNRFTINNIKFTSINQIFQTI